MNDQTVKLQEMIEVTQRDISRSLAEEIYGPNALVSFLGHTAPKQSSYDRAKSWLGDRFLAIANALGSYNDWD